MEVTLLDTPPTVSLQDRIHNVRRAQAVHQGDQIDRLVAERFDGNHVHWDEHDMLVPTT